jgi:hypothetical protein
LLRGFENDHRYLPVVFPPAPRQVDLLQNTSSNKRGMEFFSISGRLISVADNSRDPKPRKITITFNILISSRNISSFSSVIDGADGRMEAPKTKLKGRKYFEKSPEEKTIVT